MDNQPIRIKIPEEAIEIPGNEMKLKVAAGGAISLYLEPAHAGVIILSESKEGLLIQFRQSALDSPRPHVAQGG
jgi:hypothetical protein